MPPVPRSPRLNLLRHADAGDPLRWRGPDAERPLSAVGQRQIERLTKHLVGVGFRSDAILSSPKRRAVETAEPLAEALGIPVRIVDALAGSISISLLDDLLTAAGDPASATLVGHDPDFSDLLTTIVGAASLPMKKGAFASLSIARPLAPGSGRLRWLLPPDVIGRD